MKIKITGVTDALILKEISVINQNFFSDWEFVDEFEDIRYENQNTKIDKYDVLRHYYHFLTQATGIIQPWGILNGMRPTKLVHSKKKYGITDDEIKKEFTKSYALTNEKISLLLKTANHQLKVIPDLYQIDREVSIYIGIPFCPTRCSYCTFAAYATGPYKKWIAPFVEALLVEIKEIGSYLRSNNIKVTTLYLGGGTATSLEVDQLKRIIQIIEKEICSLIELREITVEAGRPDTLTLEKLQLLKDYNIRRISINPQTFHQSTLNKIGRHHSVKEVIDTFKMAKSVGIENINMDLIVGLPDEGVEELNYSLNEIKKLQPESLTVHMLAFKRKSELTQSRGLFTGASKDELDEMARSTYQFAKEEGYIPYYLYRQKNIAANLENIGYSKGGMESIYNILMMEEAQNILGLGVGASSKFLIGESVHNPKDIKTYLDNVNHYVIKKIEILELSDKLNAQSFTYNSNKFDNN